MKPWALLLFWIAAAHAAPLALPPTSHPEYVQRVGTRLPLTLVFNDDGGAQAELGEFFGDRPVVLLLGYYQCANLCSTIAEGVLESLAQSGLPRDAYRLVEVSIDPQETPDVAARKKAYYESMFGRRGADLHLLTGIGSASTLLAQSVGFRYVYDAARHQYIHPAGFVVATPDGRVSRYFLGVRFEPAELRVALRVAGSGVVGSPIERLLLLCAHYDPAIGTYSGLAMVLVRVVSIAVALALAAWILLRGFRHGRRR